MNINLPDEEDSGEDVTLDDSRDADVTHGTAATALSQGKELQYDTVMYEEWVLQVLSHKTSENSEQLFMSVATEALKLFRNAAKKLCSSDDTDKCPISNSRHR